MSDKIANIIGWYGSIAILGAYFLVTLSIIPANSIFYQFLNGTGAIGIIVISLRRKVYQSVFLNTIWLVIAIVGIIQIIFHT